MTDVPERPAEEEILEAILRGDPLSGADTGEGERLRTFVRACREASGETEGSAALSERLLAASTREDLSWRGDLRLVTGYVRDGLRSSALLRLAAASLLLHLAALPVVALFMLSEDPTIPEFRVEVNRDSLSFVDPEEDGLEDAHELEIDEHQGLDTLLVENTLRWNRWSLSQQAYSFEEVKEETPDWLRGRTAILWGAERQEPAGQLLPEEERPAYWAVLALERALDLHLVGPRSLHFSDEDLSRLNSVASLVSDRSGPMSWLAVGTLARAESYGLVSELSAETIQHAREQFPPEHPWRPLIEIDGDVRKRPPLDGLWMEALRGVDPGAVSETWVERISALGLPAPR